MNNYIEAVTEGKPLDLPSYNEDIGQWELYFTESATPWHPYSSQDLLSISFDSAQDACDTYNYYNKIKGLLNPSYSLVYKAKNGKVKMYTISKPKHKNEFGNAVEGLEVAGFRAFCFNQDGVRSFRYDRIVSLTRA